MADRLSRLRRNFLSSAVLMALLFVVLVASLYTLSTLALRIDQFGSFYPWLLLVNALALAFIAVLIGMNGWQLLKEFRARRAGSRLTSKLVVLSVLLSLVPVSLVYAFSIRFLNANINSYSDLEIQKTLDDSLELSREALALQMRTLQRDTLQVAEQLGDVDEFDAVLALNALTAESVASEMTLIGPDNRVLASTGLDLDISVQPERPDDDLVARARQGIPYVGVDPVGDGDLFIRVVTPVLSNDPTRNNSVLQALYPIASRSERLAASVESSYQRYRQLAFLRKPLIVSSILTLSLALLLSVMMAVWFALYAARRMMMPVHDLVEGTRAVADGDFNTRIHKRSKNDELGFLVQSFNYMTMQLEQSKKAEAASRQQSEEHRAWLQAVLSKISSGVVALDPDNRLSSFNQPADQLFSGELKQWQSRNLFVEEPGNSLVSQFVEQIAEPMGRARDGEWSAQISIVDGEGRRHLFCHGAHLTDASGQLIGHVIAIDDMTAMIAAQRDAAWSEVARRLAHEIRNPLTPIQLSAERLRLKFEGKLDGADLDLLHRLTHTIENQVDAMKSMVTAFADLASAPQLELRAADVNAVIAEVVELYRQSHPTATLELALDPALPEVVLDISRLRQLLHNLIKNALEAQASQSTVRLRIISAQTDRQHSRPDGAKMLQLTIEDNGPGFSPEMLDRLFEPYVTTKSRGTGLGLAIARKIVEEHHGSIRASNHRDGGGVVTVNLPLEGATTMESGRHNSGVDVVQPKHASPGGQP